MVERAAGDEHAARGLQALGAGGVGRGRGAGGVLALAPLAPGVARFARGLLLLALPPPVEMVNSPPLTARVVCAWMASAPAVMSNVPPSMAM